MVFLFRQKYDISHKLRKGNVVFRQKISKNSSFSTSISRNIPIFALETKNPMP